MAKRVKAQQGQSYTVVTGGSHRVVQVRSVRPNGWTKARRMTFLAALSMTCNVTSSSAVVGMNRSSANMLRRRDPLFAAQWADALASGYDRLEEDLLAAAIAGLSEATALNAGLIEGVRDGMRDGAWGEMGPGETAEQADDPEADERAEIVTGVVRLASMQAVQVALALLARHSAEARGYAGANSRARQPRRRATQAETDASIAKKLDSLARRLRASMQGEA